MTEMQHPVPELMKEGDVVDLLIHQHALIREMFDEVEHAPSDQRAEPFRRLVRMLAVHETAEEEIVHPYTRLRVDGGTGVVADRLKEEREAKEMLLKLNEMGPDHPGFMSELDRLRMAVLTHARAEERYEFTRLRAETTAAERRAMALGVRAAEAMAPTRPRPGVESMTRNLLLGPPAAIMDRARDLIRQAMRK
ncbi:hemerythrin domain-containing protein [Microbispora hainanensis]|jgi:hemerythrin superfamily protein|uniref:Hemerythrin domain-containing protein n=1 Tax=Microbispora hainanensis TaxID=568844 RepID=A0ABZ1SWB0_9ACTN|nr:MULTISPECIES: hemerythrin domain-containing protein [Microbispora]NJP24578.1 hemerythrin domain-containing protein [Microbispora sp. CL1-1]TQS14708.1 hemerythrin domain-containing protein [Microbispora sp. SCL1-1]